MKQDRRKIPYVLIYIILVAVLLLLLILSMVMGRFSLKPGEILSMIFGTMDAQEMSQTVLFKVRLSRVLGAALIGGALSLSGASYQGMFRNPMVSPDILGASAGASFGAALSILLGFDGIVVQLVAFVFGLLAVFGSVIISRVIGGDIGNAVMILVLTGMVISALFSAFVSITKYVADPYDQLPVITFWLMGGLTYITMRDILTMLIPFLIGGIPMLALSWRLNLLSMGDEEADSMGVNSKRLRLIYILGATLLTSSAVAVSGMIGWIGLIIPHLARMFVGVDHKRLLPVSMLLGAIFLLIVDDIARSLFAQEIPLGILTAIVGSPFFLYLLYKGRRGWG